MSAELPPGLFPPSVTSDDGLPDLAARLWRSFFDPAWMAMDGRARLEDRLALAVDGAEWERAAELLAAFVDTWPLSASIAEAGCAWRDQADLRALCIIARTAEVVRLALGWDLLDDGCWLVPPASWLRRGESAGSLLPSTLPASVQRVAATELAAQRARLASALALGELSAVLVDGEPPADAATQLALGELRLEGSHQVLVERYGLAAVRVPRECVDRARRWQDEDLLDTPLPGTPGPVLTARCQGRFMPGPHSAVRAGRPQRVGYLLWDAPVRPVMVAPVAVAVLQVLDGVRDTTAVAEALGGPRDQVQAILDELVAMGAATAR